MKIHLYGITRMRDGVREWLNTLGFGWSLDKWFTDPASAEVFTAKESAIGWAIEHGATVVEFTADLPDGDEATP